MSEQRVLFLQKSLIGTCALAALVVLASFYAVVNDAVHRAHQRATAVPIAAQGVAPQRGVDRRSALLAGIGN